MRITEGARRKRRVIYKAPRREEIRRPKAPPPKPIQRVTTGKAGPLSPLYLAGKGSGLPVHIWRKIKRQR